MGKITRAKYQIAINEQETFKARFKQHTISTSAQKAKPVESIQSKLLPFSASFVRDVSQYKIKTKSKDVRKQIRECVRFAFGVYPVCQALTNTWDTAFNQPENNLPVSATPEMDLRNWYICVATGGSLYKEFAKEFLTKKEVHCLVTCPHDIAVRCLLVYAVAKAAGCNEGEALRIAKSKICEEPFNEFWRTVIRFFALNPPTCINQLNDLYDYIHAMYDGARRNVGVPPFTMAGKTLTGLIKSKMDWHYGLRRIKVMGSEQWGGIYIPDEEFDMSDAIYGQVNWKMHQIKTAKELAEEGNRQRHCVFSYKSRCISGYISIWTLMRKDTRGLHISKVTIELSNDGNIIQARGLANRVPRADERNAINRWCRRNGLSWH